MYCGVSETAKITFRCYAHVYFRFVSHVHEEEYASSQTDLTGILPRPCWSAFEDLLDSLYGEGKEATEARLGQRYDARSDGVLSPHTAVPLLAAADALDCRNLGDWSVVPFPKNEIVKPMQHT